MKQASTLALTAMSRRTTDASASTSSSSKAPGSISAKWIDALFAKFALIWPTAWADTVDRVDLAGFKAEWQAGLQGLSGEQIGRAIERCRKECIWPPSIAEFRKAGTGGATGEQAAFLARLRESDEAHKALPKETWAETRAKGLEALKGLKAQLGMGDVA